MPKYNSIDTIPAKTFFEILKSKNYQLLKPKPKEQNLEQVFVSIYDDFFVKSENYEAKRFLELTNQIAFLNYKIAILKKSLQFYLYNQTTKQMRLDFIESVKIGYGIEIDANAKFIDEVQRVLTSEIALIENDLTMLNLELDSMVKKSKSKDFDYYEDIGVLSQVLPNNSLLKEDMTLAVYISLEKLAKKVSEQNKKKK
jgi:hypothetical protein